MKSQYYYIISGLPLLSLEGSKSVPSFADFTTEVMAQVSETDAEQVRAIRLPFDNANLLTVLEKRDRPFDKRGNYSDQEIAAAIKSADGVPGYMVRFIESFRAQKPLIPDLSWEDQLHYLFYEHTQSHPDSFIAQWFEFDYNLRNVLAAINLRRFSDILSGAETKGISRIIPVNETARSIIKSSAPDFGLSASLRWVEKVIGFASGPLADFQRNIDFLRWTTLDEMTTFGFFEIGTVLAFCIKIEMVERWQKLDPTVGQQMLKALVNDMKSGVSISDASDIQV